MAFSCLSENEFTEHEKNLKREASVRNLSAALLRRVLLWLTYYFVERALLVTSMLPVSDLTLTTAAS